MSEYYDVGSFKKTRNDKVIFVRLGTAKRRDDGGFQCYLDAIPASVNGQYEIQIVPQREKTSSRPIGAAMADHSFNDEVPF